MNTKPGYVAIGYVACIAVAAAADSSSPSAENASAWYSRIQRCAASYEKAPTKAATDLRRSQLIEQLTKEFDGRLFEFRTKVREVRWKKGIAAVFTEYELPFGQTPTPPQPLRVVRSQPIELNLTQLEAAAVRPGESFEFEGNLVFHPRRWGAVGRATKSQQLYDLRHEYLAGGYLGTFTSTDFKVKLGGKEVKGTWAATDAAKK